MTDTPTPIPWPYETCKSERCNSRRINVAFTVSDPDWAAVRGGDQSCRCLPCFDEEAQRKGVDYELLDVYPVTWTGQTGEVR